MANTVIVDLSTLFARHLETLQSRYADTLALLAEEEIRLDAVFLHSGSERTYFADDETVPFRAHGHFLHWLPVNRPDQGVLVRPGERPVYYRAQPRTYWSDTTVHTAAWWADHFDIVDLAQPDELIDHLPPLKHIAFMGENTAYASRMGFPSLWHNEPHLRNRLDYHRSLKTPYEVEQVLQANRVALQGHRAARHAFLEGRSEFDIHRAYLDACGGREQELPFETIVAVDEKSAILHYQYKRRESSASARVMLCDAGFARRGYAADITRTHVRDTVHPVFGELLRRVDRLKDEMADAAAAGTVFKALNERAHLRLTEALLDTGVLRGKAEALQEKKLSTLFLPHGLGHLLGLQVHDVGGLFKDETGILEPPPAEHKTLRLTRMLEDGMIYTIEPGIYFIPQLLEAERDTEKGACLNYSLLKELMPLGGIRMEDNVVIRGDRPDNLTARAAGDGAGESG